MRKILAILILAVCILQARIVVDDDGKEVQIPDNVERVKQDHFGSTEVAKNDE